MVNHLLSRTISGHQTLRVPILARICITIHTILGEFWQRHFGLSYMWFREFKAIGSVWIWTTQTCACVKSGLQVGSHKYTKNDCGYNFVPANKYCVCCVCLRRSAMFISYTEYDRQLRCKHFSIFSIKKMFLAQTNWVCVTPDLHNFRMSLASDVHTDHAARDCFRQNPVLWNPFYASERLKKATTAS